MSKAKILIVDDSAFLRKAVMSHLSRVGYDVEGVPSALEMAAAVRKHKPDLVLLDVDMPAIRGDKALKYCHFTEFTSVVFYSDLAAGELQEMVEKTAAKGFIRKSEASGESGLADQVQKWLAVPEESKTDRMAVPVSDPWVLEITADESLPSRRRYMRVHNSSQALVRALIQVPDLIIVDSADLEEDPGELILALRSQELLTRVPILGIGRDSRDAAKLVVAGALEARTAPLATEELEELIARLTEVAPRRSVRFTIQLRTGGEGRRLSALANAVNISRSGMLVDSERAISIGESIDVSFFLPGFSGKVTTEAKVVRSERVGGTHHVGLAFVDSRPSARIAINGFVDRSAA